LAPDPTVLYFASVGGALLAIGVALYSSPTTLRVLIWLLRFASRRLLTLRRKRINDRKAKPPHGGGAPSRKGSILRLGTKGKRHIWAADNLPDTGESTTRD
jgi:hypothetical protein